MTYKRKPKSRGKGKQKHARKAYPGVMTRARVNPGVSDSLQCRLVYSDIISLSTGLSPASHFFRGNSIFDPDFTGTGHQPMLHDQYANLYNKYIVLGSKVELETINSAGQAVVSLAPVKANTFGGSINDTIERPRNTHCILAANGSSKRLQNYQSTSSQLGVTASSVAGDWGDYGGSMNSTNPGNQWYWHLAAQHLDLSTVTTVFVQFRITYYVKMLDRKTQASS